MAKIQLQHPQGKKAVAIEENKYNLLKFAILNVLKRTPNLKHNELLKAVEETLKSDKQSFEGSVGWYAEWVKLDLEAKKIIIRNNLNTYSVTV